MKPSKVTTVVLDADPERAQQKAAALAAEEYGVCRAASSFVELADLLASQRLATVVYRSCLPEIAAEEMSVLLRTLSPQTRLLFDSPAQSSDGAPLQRAVSAASLTPQPVVEFDASARLHYLNPAAVQLAVHAKLLPSQFERILPRSIRRIVLDCLHEAGSMLSVEAEGHANGHSIFWCFRAELSRKRVVGFGTEITNYLRAEADLVRSEANFRSLVESLSDAIVRLSCQRTIEYVSPQWSRLLGHAAEIAVATRFTHWVLPEDAPQVEAALDAFFAQTRASSPVAFRVRHADGSLRWLSAAGSRMDSGDEQRPFLTLLVRDITHVRQLQQQLLHSQKMEAVGVLAGGVAHSFNNLLTGISGFVELALTQLDPSHPVSGDLREVQECTKQGAKLTRQLLAFSRQQHLEPRQLCLNDLLVKLASGLQRILGENVELHLELSSELPLLHADPGLLEQAVHHLVQNAKEAMPNTGKLTASTGQLALNETEAHNYPGLAPGTYVTLQISDTGCGLESGLHERVFDPYFTTRGNKGAGLGLAITYGIVKQHGGAISLRSEPGKGAAFRILLPAAASPPQQVGRTACPPRILVLIEPETILCDFVTRVLRRQGYEVLSADTPDKARQFLNACAHDVALILSAVPLDRSSEDDFYGRLLRKHPAIRYLLMTRDERMALASNLSLHTPHALLHKPFDALTLLERVRETLDAATAQASQEEEL